MMAAARTFLLPDLGEGLAEAEIVEWHVAVGDAVRADQPLLSVETAKAIVELPSPWSGRIAALYGRPGDVLHVHDPLVEYAPADADAGTVVGRLPDTGAAAPAVAGAPAVPAVPAAQPAPAAAGASHPLFAAPPAAGRAVRATPAVRALAARLAVDLATVAASGPEGLITAADVQRAAERHAQAGPLEPLRGTRRAMAASMARAHAEVVPVTLVDEVDVDAWPPGSDVTLRLLRALVAGVRAEPALNAWFEAGGRRLPAQIDVGIAVDTPDGLFVPVVRDAGGRTPSSLRAGLDALKAAVRTRSIPAAELRGATITLSNFGTIAGRHATPVVLPPTVAILGAGRIRTQPVAVGREVRAHRVLPLSLTFDHRAVTGGEAGRFLAAAMTDLGQAG